MQVEFTLSHDDFVAGSSAHCWRRYTPRWERVQKSVQLVLAIFFILFFFFFYFSLKDHSFATIFVGLCGVYMLAGPLLLAPYLRRRAYCRTRGKDGPIIFTITDESIHIDYPGRSTGTIEWPAILGVLDRPKVTLLYTSPAQPLMLPRRVLTDSMHDEVPSICKLKGIPFTYPKTPKRGR